MKKKAIITILLALVAMTGLAQKTVVWEKPSAFMEAGNTTLDITKVELKQTETVLHLIVNFRPGLWIRFAKESFLQTPDGKKYSITGGAKTNEKESDLQPDSLFWIPESGMAHLALHFKPVPLDTKEMDFLEGYNDGDFKFWNICDSKNKKEVAIPDILYTWKYLDEPASPCSAAFWEESILSPGLNPFEKNSYNADLLAIPSALEDENLIKAYLEFMTHEDCKNVIREYLAEKQRIGQQLATQDHIFYQKYDEVAPENILQTILDKYKGKAVLIDIWATWCGPCRAGHKAMAPMKEEMKGQNVQFVYLTSPTSPLKTWQEMLNDIDGDHYYLTEEQYHYILDKYESKGIPTYAIYNTKGEQTYKNIGFPGNDVIRKELEAASK